MKQILLTECGLDTRTINACHRHRLVTLGDFAELSKKEQSNIRNLGALGLEKSRSKCRELGLPEHTALSNRAYSGVAPGQHSFEECTELSVRTRNTMCDAHILTLESFCRMTLDEQKRIRNLGKVSLQEVHAYCEKIGLPKYAQPKDFDPEKVKSKGYLLEDCRTEISVLAFNSLERAGKYSLLQVAMLTSKEQSSIRGMGKKTLEEVRNLCTRLGLPPYCEDSSSKAMSINVIDIDTYKAQGYPLKLCPLLSTRQYWALSFRMGLSSLKQFSMMNRRQQEKIPTLTCEELVSLRNICNKVGLNAYLEEGEKESDD